MARINGVDKNSALITQVQEKLDAILLTSEMMDDPDLVSIIDGRKVLRDEVDKYNKLLEVKSILDFRDKEESTLFAFDNIYLEKSKQDALFKLANDSELNLNFPSSFGAYGEVPNHPGLKCPRPKSMLETIEDYERYLEEYYDRFDIEPSVGENGIRTPYPHEQFEWNKGTAMTPQSPDYVHPGYREYTEFKQRTAQNGGNFAGNNRGNNPDPEQPENTNNNNRRNSGNNAGNNRNNPDDGQPDLDGDPSERRRQSEERQNRRRGLNRRRYIGQRRTLKDFLLAPFRRVDEADATLANGQNWPKIKRLLVGAAVVVGGAVLISTVGGPLISTVMTGIFNWPSMLAGALTGTMTTSGGGVVALTVLDRIVMGLVGAAVPAGIIGSIYKLVKKRQNRQVPEDEVEPQPGQEGEGDDDENDNDNDLDNQRRRRRGNGGNDNGDNQPQPRPGNTDPEEPPLVIPEGTFEERVQFIAGELSKINTELNELQERQRNLQSQGNNSQLMEEQLRTITTRLEKLKLLRKRWQIELMKLTGYSEQQDNNMGDQNLSSGGRNR